MLFLPQLRFVGLLANRMNSSYPKYPLESLQTVQCFYFGDAESSQELTWKNIKLRRLSLRLQNRLNIPVLGDLLLFSVFFYRLLTAKLSLDPPFEMSSFALIFVELRRVLRLGFSEALADFFLRYSVMIPKSLRLSSNSALSSETSFSNRQFMDSFFSISWARLSLTFQNFAISCLWAFSMSSIFFWMVLMAVQWVDLVMVWLSTEGMELRESSFESCLVVDPPPSSFLKELAFLELTEIELIQLSILFIKSSFQRSQCNRTETKNINCPKTSSQPSPPQQDCPSDSSSISKATSPKLKVPSECDSIYFPRPLDLKQTDPMITYTRYVPSARLSTSPLDSHVSWPTSANSR